MWKRAWAWIAVCVSNVVATFVVYGITMNIWLSVLIGCCGGFCLLCGLLYCRTEKIHRTLTNLDKPSSLQPPQCCALHRAGFSQVFEKASQSLELTLELASTRYSFLGVSAKAVLANPDFPTLLKEKTKRGCSFQILLLDPKQKRIVTEHAKQEGRTMDALLYEIQQSIADLKTLAEQCDGKLEVWTYANPPLFRLVLINNERVFVNFYGAKEHMGVDTPQLVFLKSDVSFFIPFLGLYERMLAGSTRVV